MKIFVGSDHGGYNLKEHISNYLVSLGHEVINCGCFGGKACDYPDVAKDVCDKYLKDEEDEKNKFGIVICGTGIGISISANKFSEKIRCALCNCPYMAIMGRQHNNANFLALGARIIAAPLAEEITTLFLTTEFTNEERHNRRIKKLEKL